MSLKLPRVRNTDPSVQQTFDALSRRFPLRWPNLAGVYSQLYNAADYGDFGDGASIQAAIEAAEDAGGGVVYIPSGEWIVNDGLEITGTAPVYLRGAGMAMNSGDLTKLGVRIRRTAGTTTILRAAGTVDAHGYVEISDIHFHGGNLAGIGVDLECLNNSYLHRLRISDCVGHHALRLRRVYNSSGDHLYFNGSGDGTTKAAVLFDGLPEGQGGCDTVTWSHVEFEDNCGTDLKLTGDTSSPDWGGTNDVYMTNVKMEGGRPAAVNAPYLDLAYAQHCRFANMKIAAHGAGASNRTSVPPIRQNHPYGSTRANQLTGVTIDDAGTPTYPYAIEILGGQLAISNLTVIYGGEAPTIAAIRVDAAAAADALHLNGSVSGNMPPSLWVSDARTRPSVASAATITLPTSPSGLIKVTGTTDIDSITACPVGYRVTLDFAGILTVNDGTGNLKLGLAFVTTADDTLSLVCDGTNWLETSRSTN